MSFSLRWIFNRGSIYYVTNIEETTMLIYIDAVSFPSITLRLKTFDLRWWSNTIQLWNFSTEMFNLFPYKISKRFFFQWWLSHINIWIWLVFFFSDLGLTFYSGKFLYSTIVLIDKRKLFDFSSISVNRSKLSYYTPIFYSKKHTSIIMSFMIHYDLIRQGHPVELLPGV